MELVPVSRDNVPNLYRYGKNKNLIMQFLEMDADTVEVKNTEHKDNSSLYTSLFQTAKRMNCGVLVRFRDNKVYLVKEVKE